MRHAVLNISEMIIGAILVAAGLWYLTWQYRSIDRLNHSVTDFLLEDNAIYQQYNDATVRQISNEELYSIIMGYREYPIVIDGAIVEMDGTDYGYYFTLVKDEFYIKTYEYNSYHDIVRIVYTSTGV